MNRKGFTLIELLGVIVVLGVIAVIAFPPIIKLIDDSRNNGYKILEMSLERAAKGYVTANVNYMLPANIGDTTEVDLTDMKNGNFIDDIKDVKNAGTSCTGKVIIKKTATGYDYYPYLKCGTNYTTTLTEGSLNNLLASVTSVFNVGPNNYTITITPTVSDLTKNDANELITPTSTIGLYKKSLIDYSTWVNGTTGGQTGFTMNGTAAESQRVLKTNPWGVNDIVWATLANDVTSDADGGWNGSTFVVDSSKKYRFTTWIRRENSGTGNGTTYFGVYGYNAAVTNIGVALLSTGAANTNYYFGSSNTTGWPLIVDNWMLFVSYVHPYTYSLTTTDPTSGVYNTAGTKTYSLTDCKWQQAVARTAHRSYLYYSTKIDERHYWYRPRVDLVDGTEPTIAELLAGSENPSINAYATINTNGVITYTVPTTGTYTFSFKRADNTLYTFKYTVN